MIIPIFLTRYQECDNSSGKHGHGCKCPECLEKERLSNIPREYYKYRYAIPSSFYIKNTLFSILCWLIVLIGILVMISTLILDINDILDVYFIIFSGCAIMFFAYILSERLIKYDFECKEKIYIEIKYKETWDDKIKSLNIPKDYKLTKETVSWRYK